MDQLPRAERNAAIQELADQGLTYAAISRKAAVPAATLRPGCRWSSAPPSCAREGVGEAHRTATRHEAMGMPTLPVVEGTVTIHLFKTAKVGPLNFTVSRSGVSTSVGSRRVRVGNGPDVTGSANR